MNEPANFLDLQRNGSVLESLRVFDQAAYVSEDRGLALNAHLFAPLGEESGDRVQEEQIRHLSLLRDAPERERAIISYNLGCFALFQDDILNAKLRFAEAVRLRPDNAAALHNLAIAQDFMADFEEARQNLERALELEPGNGLVRINLALLYEEEGNREAALGMLRELLEASPANMGALFFLCRSLLSSGTREDAAEVRDLLERHGGWETYPQLRECRGHALLLLQEWEAAELAFRELLAEEDGRSSARLGLVKVLAARENFPALLEEAERYAAAEPSAQIQDIIEQIKAL
jgi:tetratricopeptide (TPR) repeat protein